MDPDTEAEQIASKILPAIFIAVFFTACQNKAPESRVNVPESKKDSAGNVSIVANRPHTKSKTIYLTFDDGPNRGTKNVLNIITAEQMPITMFLIGLQLNGSQVQKDDYVRILHTPLVEVENHSFTHAHNHFDRFYTSPQNVFDDFTKCFDSLHLTSGIVRTPGRNIWRTKNIQFTDMKKSAPAMDSVFKNGYTAVGWDVEWHFDRHLKLVESADYILNRIDSFFAKGYTKTPNELVFLTHDQIFSDPTDSAALVDFIQKLKKKDAYNFEVISNYPHLKN
jgi:peptidoglycan-N-acetylglucosamine deacetylase